MNPVIILLLSLALWVCSAGAKGEPLVFIGVARIDITPEYPIRLSGFGSRRTNSEGVTERIFAKALALGTDEEGPSILLTVDNCGVSGAITDEVAARLLKRTGISRERIALCSSHTHSAPMLTGVLPNLFAADILPEQQDIIERYTRELVVKLERVALDALHLRAPSRLSWTEGTVSFAKNRRVMRNGQSQFGDNDAGPVDHTLALLIVRSTNDLLRAVLANYACHCTTLSENFVHGDWAGCAQEAIEREHPGAVALISIGCGADANPAPRGKREHAQAHGEEMATEVRRLLALSSKPLAKPPQTKLKRLQLDFDPLPTRAQWEERAQKPGIVGYHAKKNLARLDRGEKLPTNLPYVVQTWTFGDQLAMVFLGGEVVVDYERRLKREFDGARLWVNGYANDVPCYIPSRRILTEGGYEAEDSLWYYDRPARLAMSSEDRIIKTVHELLPRKFAANTNRAELPRPLSPQQALNSMRVAPEFVVDLVAAEPLVVDPVAIDWGADGKLWVVEMRDYPMGLDGKWKPGGVVKFLQDTNSDGHYDTAKVFLDNLPFPTGVFAWHHGVLICAAPDIIYAEDTTGDGRADVVRKVFTGFATNNYQARVNSLSLGLDNWVYGANGLLGGDVRFVAASVRRLSAESVIDQSLDTSTAANAVSIRGRDFRMNPDNGAFEPASGLTQQGRVRDDYGNWFGCDNTHQLWHYPLADEYVRRNPHMTAPAANVQVPQDRDWNRVFPVSKTLERFNDPQSANRITSACGLEIYRDDRLGASYYGNAFTCEPVHNLVHREVLTPDGVTFRSTRATNELNREFLASTDNWFRPVQVRTGPDGALWVVDMYRHVIEHPRWIPSNRLAQLDPRAGSDQGRIYRVYRKDAPPRSLKDFTRLSSPELAAALDSPNGTERDIIHRELLNRGDEAANTKLAALATNSSRPAVRVQALAVLDALGGVPPQRIDDDPDPHVQVQALRLARQTRNRLVEIVAGVTNGDARVRFQAALALHGFDHADEWLVNLLPEASTNVWMRAAVLCSAAAVAPRLLPAATSLAETTGQVELLNALLLLTTTSAPIREQAQIIADIAPTNATQSTAWRFGALATLLNRSSAGEQANPVHLPQALRLACDVIANNEANQPTREAALRFSATQIAGLEEVDFYRACLRPGTLQITAIEALAQSRDRRFPILMLGEWSGFSPAARAKVLETLSSRSEWTEAMLVALERNNISPTEVPVALRNRLLADQAALTRNRATKLWPPRSADRLKLVAKYRKAMTSSGDVQRGRDVFDRNCASCHHLHGRGAAVGPDLATWRDKSTDDCLVAILDPNAAVEPRYVNYSVEMKSGEIYQGVFSSETATTVKMVSPGLQQSLQRSDIKRIETTALSLMPEGLEQGITTSAMEDLLAFLQKPIPRQFGSASEEQINTARKESRAQRLNGFGQLVLVSERLDYPSWLGRLPLLHCRQTDGQSRVKWQPVKTKASEGFTKFRMPAAMGHYSQPAGQFTLRLNGKASLNFNVALDDSTWESHDGRVQLNYQVMEANAEDSNGVLTISLAHELMAQEATPTFEVIGSAANSQRWFGLYDTTSLPQ